MRLFEQSPYYRRFINPLLAYDSTLRSGRFEIKHFPNGEVHIQLDGQLEKQGCLIAGSIAPPETNLFELLLISDALKRNGALFVKAFLPYLAYSRQDKPEPGSGGGIEHIGALLKVAGIDEIITVDVHSRLGAQAMGLSLRSISAAPLIAKQLQILNLGSYTLVAPDEGAIERTNSVAQLSNCKNPVAYLKKQRVNGLVHRELVGAVTENAVIVDDILDTGNTLLSACKLLRSHGAGNIVIMITHGLFTGSIWKQLFDLDVSALYVTDSYPHLMHRRHVRVHLMPLEPLIPQVLTGTPQRKLTKKGARI